MRINLYKAIVFFFLASCLTSYVSKKETPRPKTPEKTIVEKIKETIQEEEPLVYVTDPPKRDAKTDFIAYKRAVAYKESTNTYDTINSLGYVGRYQFGSMACEDIGVTKKRLLQSGLLQDKAFLYLLKLNKYRLRHYIPKYNNCIIKGILVTESGILAGAHLVGHGNVKKWLRSRGRENPKDANGMGVEEYIRDFSGFNMKIIPAKKLSLP